MKDSTVDKFYGCLDKYYKPDWGTDGKTFWCSTRFQKYHIAMLSTGEVLDIYPLEQCPNCGEWLDLITYAIHQARGK